MAKEQSPQGSCCFLSWGMGSNKARVPSCYETLPQSWLEATGSQLWQRAPGAASGPTGTPRERSQGRRDGVAGRTTDTRQVLLYLSERCLINHHPLQHLLRLPEKKKKVPCWTLPTGLVCPLVPDSGPASLGLPCQHPAPGRHSLIYVRGRPGTPRHGSYPALVRQTPPFVTGQGTPLGCISR